MFTLHRTEGEARCGVLKTRGGAIDTPALLVYSHRGSPLNLTPDLLERLKPDVQAVQLDVLQL
jgi:queuine/archaeosine tRNA-ribosyltransferase